MAEEHTVGQKKSALNTFNPENMKNTKNKKKTSVRSVIVRTISAGVFAGELAKFDAKTGYALINNARRIWYWDGAASLSQLSQHGTSKPENCKFPEAVPSVVVLGVIEILPLSQKAINSINSVKIWQQYLD